jgi:hypothetical protein
MPEYDAKHRAQKPSASRYVNHDEALKVLSLALLAAIQERDKAGIMEICQQLIDTIDAIKKEGNGKKPPDVCKFR